MVDLFQFCDYIRRRHETLILVMVRRHLQQIWDLVGHGADCYCEEGEGGGGWPVHAQNPDKCVPKCLLPMRNHKRKTEELRCWHFLLQPHLSV